MSGAAYAPRTHALQPHHSPVLLRGAYLAASRRRPKSLSSTWRRVGHMRAVAPASLATALPQASAVPGAGDHTCQAARFLNRSPDCIQTALQEDDKDFVNEWAIFRWAGLACELGSSGLCDRSHHDTMPAACPLLQHLQPPHGTQSSLQRSPLFGRDGQEGASRQRRGRCQRRRGVSAARLRKPALSGHELHAADSSGMRCCRSLVLAWMDSQGPSRCLGSSTFSSSCKFAFATRVIQLGA